MSRFTSVLLVAATVSVMLVGQQAGAQIVTDSLELHLDANDPSSFGYAREYSWSPPDDANLPGMDSWFNLVKVDPDYLHTLGDIDDGAGGDLPVSQPAAILGRSGTGTGATRSQDNPIFTPASGNQPAYFSGSGDGYGAGDQPGGEITLTDSDDPGKNFTWELWYRPSTLSVFPDNISIFGNGSGNNGSLIREKYVDSGGGVFKRQILFGYRSGEEVSAFIELANQAQPTEWFHIVGVHSEADAAAHLYINGANVDTELTSTRGGTQRDIGLFWIPDRGHQDKGNGSISIARIYHKPLSAAEVLQNYNAEKDSFPDSVTTIVTENLELHLRADDAQSWYGGSMYASSPADDGGLPWNDSWFNLVKVGPDYLHTLGDIDDGAGNDMPVSFPAAIMGRSGTGTGATRSQDNPIFTPASGNQPAYFSGYGDADGNDANDNVGGVVTLTDSDWPGQDFTWEIWYRLSSPVLGEGELAMLMGNDGGSGGSYIAEKYRDIGGGVKKRWIEFHYKPGELIVGPYLDVADLDNPTEWFHIVGVHSTADAAQHLYINGAIAGTNPTSARGDTQRDIGIFWIPARGHQDKGDGDVTVVRIYHKALSPAEVLQNFQSDHLALFGPPAAPRGTTVLIR